jgi:hypothetical protein
MQPYEIFAIGGVEDKLLKCRLFCAGTRLRLGSRTFASAAHRGYYVAIIGAAGQIRVEVRCRSGNLNRRYRGIRSGAGPAVNVVLRNTRGRRLGPP